MLLILRFVSFRQFAFSDKVSAVDVFTAQSMALFRAGNTHRTLCFNGTVRAKMSNLDPNDTNVLGDNFESRVFLNPTFQNALDPSEDEVICKIRFVPRLQRVFSQAFLESLEIDSKNWVVRNANDTKKNGKAGFLDLTFQRALDPGEETIWKKRFVPRLPMEAWKNTGKTISLGTALISRTRKSSSIRAWGSTVARERRNLEVATWVLCAISRKGHSGTI